ncbi:DoxX family protein [Amycolatopsis sp. NPDC051061]|uniref:DoxX family protein n=1 Tax=Amycolatopsis sp. NPDC051061 TaxID=3155042 RepID=UPI0034176CC9
MNIALWVVQVVLAFAFAAAGLLKATQPIAKLGGMLPWVTDFTVSTVRLIGVVEVLGALGLVLPALTGILPVLTPMAAVGLALTMVGAAVLHVRRKENNALASPIVLFLLAAFVVWGRFGPYAL